MTQSRLQSGGIHYLCRCQYCRVQCLTVSRTCLPIFTEIGSYLTAKEKLWIFVFAVIHGGEVGGVFNSYLQLGSGSTELVHNMKLTADNAVGYYTCNVCRSCYSSVVNEWFCRIVVIYNAVLCYRAQCRCQYSRFQWSRQMLGLTCSLSSKHTGTYLYMRPVLLLTLLSLKVNCSSLMSFCWLVLLHDNCWS